MLVCYLTQGFLNNVLQIIRERNAYVRYEDAAWYVWNIVYEQTYLSLSMRLPCIQGNTYEWILYLPHSKSFRSRGCRFWLYYIHSILKSYIPPLCIDYRDFKISIKKFYFYGKGTPKTSWIPRDRLKYLRMNILSRLLSLFEFGLACFMYLFHQISNRTNYWDSKRNS